MMANSSPDDPGWFNRERLLIVALGIATFLALFVCYLIIQPFIPAITIAVAVAVATKRPFNWLRQRIPSSTIAAAISLTLVACLIVLPLSFLMTFLVQQIVAGAEQMQANGGPPDWHSMLNLPPALAPAIDWIEKNLDLKAQWKEMGKSLGSQMGDLVAGSVNVGTQIVILLFVLFFLYRDRDRALEALRSLLPLSDSEGTRMLSRIENTILAIVNGSITVALVQALLSGVMYTLLGIPAPLILAFVTFIMALIPVFGTFVVWAPVAVLLLLSGSWMKALILLVWGVLVVGTIDNVLYPYLVGDRLRLHTIPTFFAIAGGIFVFGPEGLFLGPVAVAVTLGLLDVWWWRTAGGRSAEQTSLAPSATLPLTPAE